MKEKLEKITVYIQKEKYKKFREYCFFSDKSMSYVLNQFIDLIFKNDKDIKEK